MVIGSPSSMANAPGASIEVYLNPADLQRIQEIDHARVGSWSLQADARLEPGECRVRSGTHEADAGCHQRLGACMEQISEQLLQQREGDQPVPAESLEDAA